MKDRHVVVLVEHSDVCFLLPFGLEGLLQQVSWPGSVTDVPVLPRFLLLILLEASGGGALVPLLGLDGHTGCRSDTFAFLLVGDLGDHHHGRGRCPTGLRWLLPHISDLDDRFLPHIIDLDLSLSLLSCEGQAISPAERGLDGNWASRRKHALELELTSCCRLGEE